VLRIRLDMENKPSDQRADALEASLCFGYLTIAKRICQFAGQIIANLADSYVTSNSKSYSYEYVMYIPDGAVTRIKAFGA